MPRGVSKCLKNSIAAEKISNLLKMICGSVIPFRHWSTPS